MSAPTTNDQREQRELYVVTDEGEVKLATGLSCEGKKSWYFPEERVSRTEGTQCFYERERAVEAAHEFLAALIGNMERRLRLLKANQSRLS